MRNLCLTLAVFCLAILGTQAAHYAVLIAGSYMWWNYRHQSDVFHAYQVLKSNGIPAENIITMAYDDIASDKYYNPFPGKIFNKPSPLLPGKDVYAGVKIDYDGFDVNSTNFLAVLRGDSAATGGKRVLNTTEKDNIFVFFADHGATGLLALPDDNDVIYADDLMRTFNYMHENKKYKEMVVYIEACESGSMFENLLAPNISIYATTASNSTESSYATYCDPKDLVFGKHIGTCLGDLYAVNFLENLESTDPSKETLQEQYEIIKNKTTESPVLQFGDLTIASEIIGRFEGNSVSRRPLAAASESEEENNDKYSSLVDSRYVKLHFLQSQHNKLQSQQSENALAEELNSIQRFDTHFQTFAAKFGLNVHGPVGHIDFPCLKARVAMYTKVCGTFSDYGLKYVKYLHFTCVQGVDIYDFEEALMKSCT